MSKFLSGRPSAIATKKAGLRILSVRFSSRMNGQKENAPPPLSLSNKYKKQLLSESNQISSMLKPQNKTGRHCQVTNTCWVTCQKKAINTAAGRPAGHRAGGLRGPAAVFCRLLLILSLLGCDSPVQWWRERHLSRLKSTLPAVTGDKNQPASCILGETVAYLLGTFDTDAHLKPASLAPAAKGRRQRRRLQTGRTSRRRRQRGLPSEVITPPHYPHPSPVIISHHISSVPIIAFQPF